MIASTSSRSAGMSCCWMEAGVAMILVPGTWFVFSDQKDSLPPFINAVEVELPSSYVGNIFVGGSADWLTKIFYLFTLYELIPFVTDEFTAAVQSIIAIYCEVRRSRGMRNLVFQRMDDGDQPSALPDLEFRTKNMWDSFSGEVLTAKLNHTLLEKPTFVSLLQEGCSQFRDNATIDWSRG